MASSTPARRLSTISGFFVYLLARGDITTNPVPRGLPTEDVLADLPDREVEDVHEALRFAAEELRERHLPLQPSA